MATKAKNHQGTAKRINLSGSGKMMHRHPYGNHFLSKKSSSRKRSIGGSNQIAKGVRQKTRRRLGV